MKLYRKLSKISFLKNSYVFKFLFVTFIGIHIPLIGLLFFILYGEHSVSPHSIVVFTLAMTLIATVITLWVLNKLIKPILLTSKALDNYKNNRVVSKLPTEFKDEAGLLMANIHESIMENEKYINDKQDLVYLLSHDLRTFAGNSRELARLILEENPSDSVTEYADLICQSTNQQFVFIETFIQLIKDEDEISKKRLKPQNIKLSAILSLVGDQVAQKLASKQIELVTVIEVEEVCIKIEKDLLIRVLVNLIDNAIKFSFPNSEIKVRIHLEKGELVFEVSDSGIGFNPKYKEELFKKFTNRGRLGTANEPSTGIGLYLCKKIVEKYHGKLLAESEGVNKGATFSIFFENIN
ncbi:HAMP domain-containing sensor histidine kinase [Flavobacterium sp.]|uniref:sensor histidine kinase n=1 Tax=Flavobacterium sp. TaxID=239 RepID=UPI001B6DC567|nr:HAMP domain-containing sensor histidine kinase [Flavobacterium sp.]MBP6180417.1 HAMP domain-containing histidine kinase [Flavobacterium sp.]